MPQAVDSLVVCFSELQEVLENPLMQYAVLNSFFVRVLGRKALASRLTQTIKVISEVQLPKCFLWMCDEASDCWLVTDLDSAGISVVEVEFVCTLL